MTGYQTPAITMQANTPTRLQVLLPGDTPVPGDVAHLGKTGSLTSTIAGENYLVTARLTDDYFNAIGNGAQGATLRLTTTDPYDPSDPDTSVSLTASSTSVSGSSVTWTHPFQRASTTGWAVTVSTQTGPFYIANTTGPVVVTPDTLTGGGHTHQLLIILPGETYTPGDTAQGGLIGAPNFTGSNGHAIALAGDQFPVTVIGTDRFYNQIFDTDNPLVLMGANAVLFSDLQSVGEFPDCFRIQHDYGQH